MSIELVTTDGIFALDGGEWEVTNNIWLVGDDREVMVFDAAHPVGPSVLTFTDAGVVPNPGPGQLAEIAHAAATARTRSLEYGAASTMLTITPSVSAPLSWVIE